jgi:hypothetical protein
MPPRAAGGKGKKAKRARERIQEEASEQNVDDDDMNLMDQANMGGIDQEQLTNEQKDEQIIKTLNSNNPQAPHNICQFSFKDRHFKVDDQVEHLYFHH